MATVPGADSGGRQAPHRSRHATVLPGLHHLPAVVVLRDGGAQIGEAVCGFDSRSTHNDAEVW